MEIKTKICTKCSKEKDLNSFGNATKGKNGKKSQCKECEKEYQKKYYSKEENIEKRKEHGRKSYKKNPNRKKEYFKKNSNELKQYYKEYREKNFDKLKAKEKKYREENKEKINKRVVNMRKKDPELRLKHNIRTSFIKNLKRKFINKKNNFNKYTGIEYNKYINHFKNDLLWKDFCNGNDIHLDHIIPCSAYNFNDSEDIKKCWNPRNLRLLPAKENISKSDNLDYGLINKHNIFDLLPNRSK